MGIREELEAQIAQLQAKLAVLGSMPEDVFPFGTVVIFAPSAGPKWYYVKVGEEQWRRLDNRSSPHQGMTQSLAEWILYSLEQSHIGYFEVYVMKTEEVPIFASA